MSTGNRDAVSLRAGLRRRRPGAAPFEIGERMRANQFSQLSAFVAVAEHRNFTKAATHLGLSPPSLSQTVRSLETRLGVRLFNRTTRSVALTAAGERLLADMQPLLAGIDKAVDGVNQFRDTPMGC